MCMSYFTEEEFACQCGRCGRGYEEMSPILLDKLEFARHVAGIPFVLTSALRCEAHNIDIGGSPTSSHQYGLAVDIKADDSVTRMQILKALLEVGFDRIGISDSFIHVDVDYKKRKDVCWVY